MRKAGYLLGILLAVLCLRPAPAAASELTVEQKGDRISISGSFSYEVIPADDETEIPAGYEETRLTLYGTEVTAYVPTDGEEDFFLLYCRTEEGISGFYQYDRQEKTLQRYHGTLGKDGDRRQGEQTPAEEYNDKIMLMAGITAVACGAVILLLIGVIKLFLKMRKENDDFFY